MASSAKESDTSRGGTAERIGLLLAVCIPAALIALWASPRVARPAELPALVFPAEEVASDIAAQDALAARAVDDDDERERRTLYLAEGLAEVRMGATPEESAHRHARLAHLAGVIAARDPDMLAAVRARDVTRVMPALRADDDASNTDRASELGTFASNLERYGQVIDGRRVAPELVIRTGFLARWNAIHGIVMTDGMTPIERRAYFGWLALEGGTAPIQMRIDALDAYGAAGGTRVWEARGALAYQLGDYAESASDFERAYALTGSLRLRNHALAAAAAEVEATE